MADWVAGGNGLLQGMQFGLSIARQKKLDALAQQRDDEDRAYRQQRDESQDSWRQKVWDHSLGREAELDSRYAADQEYKKSQDDLVQRDRDRDYALRERVSGAQLANYQQQMAERSEKSAQESALRKNLAVQHLLRNGGDDGQLASILNEDGGYADWLSARGLDGAQFDHFRMNDTGKGELGMVTFLRGSDRKTGKPVRGVMTANASADPGDPVQVMPMSAVHDFVSQAADEAEAAGDADGANKTRAELLRVLEAQGIALGGEAPQPKKWGPVQYSPAIGAYQEGADGGIKQLRGERGYGLSGGRGAGGSGGRNSAFTNQIYKQASAEFPDDPESQVDNSTARNLTVSLAQDFDLRSDGALAPGVYVQVAKEASQGLALSRADAERRAIDELNQGKFLASMDAEDDEVQQRAAAIMERDKAQFATRYAGMLESAAGYRAGGQQMSALSAEQPDQAVSLDEQVSDLMDRAKASGRPMTRERALAYLESRAGGSGGAGDALARAPVDEPKATPKKWSEIAENSLDKRLATGFRHATVDAVYGAKDMAVSGLKKVKQYGEMARGQNRFAKAMMMGTQPTAKQLAEWLPSLEGADQEQALALMAELYPDEQLTKQALQAYNPVAAR